MALESGQAEHGYPKSQVSSPRSCVTFRHHLGSSRRELIILLGMSALLRFTDARGWRPSSFLSKQHGSQLGRMNGDTFGEMVEECTVETRAWRELSRQRPIVRERLPSGMFHVAGPQTRHPRSPRRQFDQERTCLAYR